MAVTGRPVRVSSTHMIRVPEGDRFELRLADGAVNPYLMPAAVLAAGLEGASVLREALGSLVPAYLKLKHVEWNDYARHLTQWERDTTLDC